VTRRAAWAESGRGSQTRRRMKDGKLVKEKLHIR
jgi:hypothetical protein